MTSPNRRTSSCPDLLDPVVVKAIRRTAYGLSRRPGFRRDELADLEQTLIHDLAVRSCCFRPSRGSWRAFAITVVNRQADSLARSRLALRRSPFRQRHLRGDWSFDPRRPHLGFDSEAEDRRVEMAILLASLPPNLRALADCLSEVNVTAAARRLGISRRTARDHLVRLRRRFEEAGLQNYC